jgi:hypothetical protein
LAPTQLRGLKGVNVIVDVSGPLGDELGPMKRSLKTEVEKQLSQAGLELSSADGQWFYFDVQVVKTECAGSQESFALLISSRLRERVALRRDATIPMTEDGITWSKWCLKATRREDLPKVIRETREYYVGEFVEHWQIVNTLRSEPKRP